jgi:sugar phosphate isomerase/epimerase
MEIVLYTYKADVPEIVARARALGVTQVNLLLQAMPGYAETGVPEPRALRSIARSLADEGITLSSANGATGRNPGLLTDPTTNRRAIDAQLETLDSLAGAGIGVLLYYQHFPHPTDPAATERYWHGFVAFMGEMTERAEATGIKIANHPVWRCLPAATKAVALGQGITMERYPEYRDAGWDGPYLLSSHLDALRLFEAVPSKHNGICFCTGMHIMGANPHELVDRVAERIHHAQMRDVRGRWPHAEEVFLGEGEIDFGNVLSLLEDAGYTGVIGREHLGEPRWPGDDPEMAAVEFLRGKLPVRA